MNRLAHWMMRLYPSHWRRRYGDEMDALLANTGADARFGCSFRHGRLRKLAVVLGLGGLLLGAAGSFLIAPISKATVLAEPAAMRQIAPIVLSRTLLACVHGLPPPSFDGDGTLRERLL